MHSCKIPEPGKKTLNIMRKSAINYSELLQSQKRNTYTPLDVAQITFSAAGHETNLACL